MPNDGELLYAALDALRRAPAPRSPHWRVVHDHVRRFVRDEDLAQEAVVRVVRGVAGFAGTSPGEAVRWLRTIANRRTIDSMRKRGRDPLAHLVAARAGDEEEAPLVERLAGSVERADEARLAPIADRVLDAVTAHLAGERAVDDTGHAPARQPSRPLSRALGVASARAAWLRIVHGFGAAEIVAALAPVAPSSTDALYKWVERGRAHLLAAIATIPPDDELDKDALEALAALFGARRVDAGQARPTRRKGGGR